MERIVFDRVLPAFFFARKNLHVAGSRLQPPNPFQSLIPFQIQIQTQIQILCLSLLKALVALAVHTNKQSRVRKLQMPGSRRARGRTRASSATRLPTAGKPRAGSSEVSTASDIRQLFFQIRNFKSRILVCAPGRTRERRAAFLLATPRFPRLLSAKSHTRKRCASSRKPPHIFRQPLLRHRRSKFFQPHPPRRRRQAPRHIAPSPVRVTFSFVLPNKKQSFILKFGKHLF